MTGSMWQVAVAAALFVGGHFALSAEPLRSGLRARLGDNGFRAVYSTIAIASLAWLGVAYGAAPYVELWPQAHWARAVPTLVMPIALLLVVCGISQFNPTVTGQGFRDVDGDPAPGILKLTRHPVMWGLGLWALSHLPPNGDLASIILFGGLATLALGGTRAIDARRKREDPSGFARIAAVTANLPLAALLSQRQRLRFADIGLWRILIAAIVYVVLFHAHRWVAGVALT
ncbi:MAG TPA: NnrU family protein [Alphaproteobacteria bacterium]|nr:NnrU family protein [Alphaproteobacteria bacterium]